MYMTHIYKSAESVQKENIFFHLTIEQSKFYIMFGRNFL